jgi:SanA protein
VRILRRRPRRRTLVIAAAVRVAVPALLVAVANAIVVLGSGGSVERVDDAPHAQFALVLGAQVRSDGSMSGMLADRVAVAGELYRAGKVDRVLVSGDHGRAVYDEPNTMKRALVAAGVPEEDIFTDHAGFDTWDSVVRARKVFQARSALVVTQGFHMPRAVWLARHAGLDAHGVVADRHDYGRQGQKSALREVLGRVKAVGNVAAGTKPRFLGPPVPITGDARASDG